MLHKTTETSIRYFKLGVCLSAPTTAVCNTAICLADSVHIFSAHLATGLVITEEFDVLWNSPLHKAI
jgi:hypothetical protein